MLTVRIERRPPVHISDRAPDQPGFRRRTPRQCHGYVFANQALAAEYMVKNPAKLQKNFTVFTRNRC
jgi:hypothetical protein